MINKPNIYNIDVSLNELYCIEMDEYEMGGSWVSSFINYVKLDFYFCNEGIEYNKNNNNCTKYEDIINKIGENNSLKIEIFYPNVQFQPKNISNPIIVIYKHLFYRISKFSNKIDRLYFQEYILNDDLGWINKKNINSSYFGFSRIDGDSYTTTDQKDFINEGSTSKSYSLNFYLEPGIIYYERKYKKIIQIIDEGLPILYVVFIVFKKIVKTFKFAEGNKKFFELLFENLREKKDKFRQFTKEMMDKKQNKINKNNILDNDNNNNLSSIYLSLNKNIRNSSLQNSSNIGVLNDPIHNIRNENNVNQIYKNNNNNTLRHNTLRNKRNSSINNQRLNFLYHRANKTLFLNKNVRYNSGLYTINTKYKISRLFPYRYYFCSIFVRNFDISNWKFCFSNKFTKVYKFLSRMFDVSTYLILLRQFQILKNAVLKTEDMNLIESSVKINVGEKTFLKNMDECISNGKFDIFAQNITKKIK